MKETIVGIISGIVFLIFGLLCCLVPESVRDYYFNNFVKGVSGLKKWIDLSNWIDSYPGIWFFRVFGIASLIAAVLILYAVIRRNQL